MHQPVKAITLNHQKTTKNIRIDLFLFFVSILISLIFFEVGLRIFINYRHRHFIVKEQDGILYYFSNPKSWEILQGQYFLKNKPKRTYRIFAFGGSTTEGSIHEGKVSFTKFLQWKVENVLPLVPVEIINFGKRGDNSRQVLEKVKIALKYKPDLFIVYSGHNEFIRFDETTVNNPGWIGDIFDKLYLYEKLFKRIIGTFIDQTPLYLIEKRSLEDKLICKPEKFIEVQREYQKNIEKIVQIAKDSKVDIILSNVVGNYRGWEPNRSIHKATLSDKQLKGWRYHFFQGREFQEKKEFVSAIKEFELAEKIDPDFAELNYQLARSYEQVGLFQEAKKEYLNAVDNDGDPKIASSMFNKIIKKTCVKNQIPCVDVLSAFERESENSLIGYNIMVDAHHPRIFGELLIAKEIVKVMADFNLPVPAKQWSFYNDKPDKWYLSKPNLTRSSEVLYHQNRGLWFTKLSTRRYVQTDRIERAKYHFDKAHEIDPTSFKTYIGLAILDLLEKNLLQSKTRIQKACEINSDETVKVLKDLWISNLLFNNRVQVSKDCKIESL